MNNKKPGEFEKFARFVCDEDEEAASSPESLKRLSHTIGTQLERAKNINKRSWITRAQTERRQFDSSIQNIVEVLSSKFGSRNDLVAAIKNGALGGKAQGIYQLQFRNRSVDELSDDDLRAIVGDQEILELLKEFKDKKKE